MATTEKTRLQQLEEQETLVFARRDKMQKQIEDVAGRELSSLEFLIIRQAMAEYEECEERIETIQARMNLAKAGH
jgi:predicted transcriptional regulator